MAKGSLVAHRQTQHGVEKWGLGQEGEEEAGENNPGTYRMSFPAKAGPRTFPVEGFSGRVSTRMAMRVHFWHRNIGYTVVILEEFKLPHPQ